MAEHAHNFMILTILGLVTVLLIFGMKYVSATRQTRLRLDQEGAYRELADRLATVQAAAAASMAALQADMVEMKMKLTAINTVLHEVE